MHFISTLTTPDYKRYPVGMNAVDMNQRAGFETKFLMKITSCNEMLTETSKKKYD
jgi:hypothetical protein